MRLEERLSIAESALDLLANLADDNGADPRYIETLSAQVRCGLIESETVCVCEKCGAQGYKARVPVLCPACDSAPSTTPTEESEE